MAQIEPIYRVDNLTVAYQLNWSLTVFSRAALPESQYWFNDLSRATEPDGVRILEHVHREANVHQFLISTKPQVTPASIVKSVKGRLQHAVREEVPRVWRRNYRLVSVGDSNCATLEAYVARQPQHHQMADPRVQEHIEAIQFHDPAVDLTAVQYSLHGQYIANLQLVFENCDRLSDIRPAYLQETRDTVVRVSRKKGYGLSRMGVAANHFHVLLGCGMQQDPLSIALSLMNNIAYVQKMKPVLEFSFYAGTFGTYDLAAVRRRL
ncbi:MAG: transposase [Pirellulaceae bacterium]|jgi:REP element-mobilizing transposase RayT|nr:transposase [Pirellulaceae bacterium]